MKKIAIFFVSCLIVFWAGRQFYEQRVVELKIHTTQGDCFSIRMPWKDKQRLTYLFYKMFIRDDGGYTLCGCKPMHLNGYIRPFLSMASITPSQVWNNWDLFLMPISLSNIRFHQSWKTWEKYEYLLENSPFLLWREIHPFWAEPLEAIHIRLVHKKKLAEMIRKHNEDFKTVLQKNEIEGNALLREAKEHPFLEAVLRGHDGLIGTLLGYGRNNAWLFEERKQGKKTPLTFIWEESVYDFLGDRPQGVYMEDLSKVVGYPTFLADPNSLETQQLKAEFLKAREKIIGYYQGKDFLEATLSLLIDKPPN